MIDFSRTFCDLHPNELITNFCCKGTPALIKRNVTLVFALPASVVILKVISKSELHQNTKISAPPIVKCRKISAPGYLASRARNQGS